MAASDTELHWQHFCREKEIFNLITLVKKNEKFNSPYYLMRGEH
jgi:hypothetical protein